MNGYADLFSDIVEVHVRLVALALNRPPREDKRRAFRDEINLRIGGLSTPLSEGPWLKAEAEEHPKHQQLESKPPVMLTIAFGELDDRRSRGVEAFS